MCNKILKSKTLLAFALLLFFALSTLSAPVVRATGNPPQGVLQISEDKVRQVNKTAEYNGATQEPQFQTDLTRDTDFTVTYSTVEGAPGQLENGLPKDAGWYLVHIKGIGLYTGNFDYDFQITKAGREAPAGLAGTSDGKITGVSDQMEYATQGSDQWTSCTGSDITGLAPGTYTVRYKESDNYLASKVATVEVPQAAAPQVNHITEVNFELLNYIDGEGANQVQLTCQTDGVSLIDAVLQVFDEAQNNWVRATDRIKASARYRLKADFSNKNGYDFEGLDKENIKLKDAGSAVEYNAPGVTGTRTAFFDLPQAPRRMFTLTFETNGGEPMNPLVSAAGSFIRLSNFIPAKNGFDFEGWFTAEDLTRPAPDPLFLTGDTTVYAKWKARPQPAAPGGVPTIQLQCCPDQRQAKVTANPKALTKTVAPMQTVPGRPMELPKTGESALRQIYGGVLLAVATVLALLSRKMR